MWDCLKLSNKDSKKEKGEGIVMNLIDKGFSDIEIQSLISVGSGQIKRCRDYDPSAEHVQQQQTMPLKKKRSVSYSNILILGRLKMDSYVTIAIQKNTCWRKISLGQNFIQGIVKPGIRWMNEKRQRCIVLSSIQPSHLSTKRMFTTEPGRPKSGKRSQAKAGSILSFFDKQATSK
ncbi:hypothetical protein HK096_004970 [Nowakowskiella sp. JEL0078]|nr:hypothetical protein HK096_004970 [Nowakowskiella sp. JEL0078]